MSHRQRINEAIENAHANIAWLARLSDAKLVKKLNNIRAQILLAQTNQQTEAIELLTIWERQVIQARCLKHEQQPELNELSEIEEAYINPSPKLQALNSPYIPFL